MEWFTKSNKRAIILQIQFHIDYYIQQIKQTI